MDDLSIVAANI